MAEETIEEAAKRLIPDKSSFGATKRNGFVIGANWKEDRIFEWLASKDYLSDKVEVIRKEFSEQFKKN